MLKEVPEKTFSALKVIGELDQNCPNLQAELEPIITSADIADVGGFIRSAELYKLISNYSTTREFLDEVSTDGVSTLVVRYIFIDYYYKINSHEPKSFEELEQFVKSYSRLNTILGHWNGSFRVIAYQDYFEKFTWNDYASKSKWDWTEIHLLDNSLTCCRVKIEVLFEYLRSAVSAHPNDMAIPRLGSNLVAKIRMDATLKSHIENRISEIISTEHLSTFLPSFLLGIIKTESDFDKWFAELTGNYETYKAFTILYGLGVACPNEESCLINFKLEINRCLANGKISAAECIQLYSLKNFLSDDVLEYLSELSSVTKSSDELTALLQFLLNNLDIHFNSKWFLTILANVVTIDDEKNIGMLNHLVYLLLEKDINLIYELISKRFEALGSKNFLKENWFELVNANKQLFSISITKWLNSDNTNVHRALLKLCTVNEIAPSDFKISTEVLLTFSLRDKLYIAIKIIGFIYSKDHLQALMFSLVELVGHEETILIDNLFMLFYNYVIYNYRTSLDEIKEILKEKRLPVHLLKFYDDLNESYEQYFKDLGRIETYPELHPDPILVQHLQFYIQNQFSEKSKNIGKTGLAALFKNTPVHSHRWAIRRENEPVHQPSPLGHFKTSMEFPSGERLNPIYQETMRRTYQRMKRDEININ